MKKETNIVGRAEKIAFPRQNLENIPAKIDTGAKTSAIWASEIVEDNQGVLSFYLFGRKTPYFNGQKIVTKSFTQTIVTSSMGMTQKRYVVKLVVKLADRKIRASFTLADRTHQIYPVLIGRNILRGKFIVDVKEGTPLEKKEKAHDLAVKYTLKSGRKGDNSDEDSNLI